MELDRLPTSEPDDSAPDDLERYNADMAFRAKLEDLTKVSQSEYDKAVMLLSGGALGVSFGYLKDIAGPPPHLWSGLLVLSWAAWTISVTSCLASHFVSGMALRRKIEGLDAKWEPPDSTADGAEAPADSAKALPLGRWEKLTAWWREHGVPWDTLTSWMNLAGGTLFAVGAFSMIAFVARNHNEQHQSTPPSSPGSAASTVSATFTQPGTGYGSQPASAASSPTTSNPQITSNHATSNSTAPPAHPAWAANTPSAISARQGAATSKASPSAASQNQVTPPNP